MASITLGDALFFTCFKKEVTIQISFLLRRLRRRDVGLSWGHPTPRQGACKAPWNPLLNDYKRKRIMDTLHAHSFCRVLALSCLIMLLAACSVADFAADSAHTATAQPLGTTFWTYRSVSSVFTAAWSPDGKRLALGEADSTVQVWDATSGKRTLTYRGHSGTVEAVAWSPDGTHIASGSFDHTVRVWNSSTGEQALTYRGHTNRVWAVAWSPDGKHIASGSEDRTVRVWDGRTGRTMVIYRGHTKGVQAVAWSPDGRYLASGSWDTTVQVWKVTTGHRILTYRGHADIVGAVAWSPDGKRIASAGDDVRIWQAS